jgi:hypothetical protein
MRWKISVGRISLNRAYCLPSWHDVTRILVDRLWPRGVRNSEAAINPWTRTIARSAPCASGSDTCARMPPSDKTPLRREGRSP